MLRKDLRKNLPLDTAAIGLAFRMLQRSGNGTSPHLCG
jgi:hypothetical protein